MPLAGAGPATGLTSFCAPEWLALREPADAAARDRELVSLVPPRASWLVRDLGCGTGSMGRWLAPQLAGLQEWVLHDRDAGLLGLALDALPAGVVARPAPGEVALTAADLAGTSLVTASALLDLLTAAEVDALAAACVDAGCPALLTLSVTGRVVLDPPHPLDAAVAAAFDAHQRRDGRLGPDAPTVTTDAFTRRGWAVHRRPSPWRLTDGPLLDEWLTGRVAAAAEQDPTLDAAAYLAARTGRTRAVVGHVDLLAVPR